MADPLSTLLSTERLVEATAGTGWLDRINDNFAKAQWLNYRTVTAVSVTVATDDDLILVDPTSNAVTLNLPAVATCDGMVLRVRAQNVANTITLDGNASETINGATTKTIGTAGRMATLFATSAGWYMQISDVP